jgi:NAD(P)H-hydrate epimerase
MKLPAFTREQVRRVDQIAIEDYAVPGIVLMENAGRSAAEIIHRVAPPGITAILCGSGNNAGDGYVIARHLQLAGREVRIVSIVDLKKLTGDARTNAVIAQKSGIIIQSVKSADEIRESLSRVATIVDALLGTGAQGQLRGLFADAVNIANSHEAMRVAIDIPTGLDCDTGQAGDPAFRASHTITFVASKVGFEQETADAYVGVVHEVGIGAPKKLLDELLERFEKGSDPLFHRS